MIIDPSLKRRVAIRGVYNDRTGYQVSVHDVETGEVITNVESIIIVLDARQQNRAVLTYHAADNKTGKLLRDSTVRRALTVDNPDIQITAYEV